MKRSLLPLDFNEQNEEKHEILSTEQIDLFQSKDTIKPTLSLKCRVCGDQASGYNFDQISCESCKAFFRRNGLRNLSDLKCRFSGSCEVKVQTRRHCTHCRLKKCFSVNMKKEWIRTEEERHLNQLKRYYKQQTKMNQSLNIPITQRKKKQLKLFSIEPYRLSQRQQLMYKMDANTNCANLSLHEWTIINNITKAYNIWALDCDTNHFNDYSLSKTTLTNFLNDEQQMYRSLILFYKQIPQFKQINIEDQILLIKCNMTHLVHIHHVLKDEFTENPTIGLYISKWINSDFHKQMSKTRHSFDYFIQHPTILKITLVVFMFTINLSRLPYEQLSFEFIDKHLLKEHQNYFITLLWKYLNIIYNENDAIRAIQSIVFPYLRYQILMHQMENIIVQKTIPSDFHPLTKSVLRLT